jgi:hypothetical protein
MSIPRWSTAGRRKKGAAAFGSAESVDRQRPSGKGYLVRRAVLVNIIVDSLGLCKVPTLSLLGTFDLENEAVLASAITGLSLYADDLFRIGDRVAAMERLFNLKHARIWMKTAFRTCFSVKGDSVLTPSGHYSRCFANFIPPWAGMKTDGPSKTTLAALGIDTRLSAPGAGQSAPGSIRTETHR